jgi:hypothetical protein
MHVRDVEAAGSNPVTSTNQKPAWILDFPVFYAGFFYVHKSSKKQQKTGKNTKHMALLLMTSTLTPFLFLLPEIYRLSRSMLCPVRSIHNPLLFFLG